MHKYAPIDNSLVRNYPILTPLTEEEIRQTFDRMKEKLRCEPSSAVVFAAPEKHNFHTDDIIVFINSGRSPLLDNPEA